MMLRLAASGLVFAIAMSACGARQDEAGCDIHKIVRASMVVDYPGSREQHVDAVDLDDGHTYRFPSPPYAELFPAATGTNVGFCSVRATDGRTFFALRREREGAPNYDAERVR
jgi:hypothetical protein